MTNINVYVIMILMNKGYEFIYNEIKINKSQTGLLLTCRYTFGEIENKFKRELTQLHKGDRAEFWVWLLAGNMSPSDPVFSMRGMGYTEGKVKYWLEWIARDGQLYCREYVAPVDATDRSGRLVKGRLRLNCLYQNLTPLNKPELSVLDFRRLNESI